MGSVGVEKIESGAHQRFIDAWCQEYQARVGKPYHVQGGKDGSLVKRLLTTFGYEELARRRQAFFFSSDPFILKAGFTIGVFSSQVNKLADGRNHGEGKLREAVDKKYGAAFEALRRTRAHP